MPATLEMGTVGWQRLGEAQANPAFFDAKGLTVTQHEATSLDGTRVPYFQVSREGLKLDGTNPTLLYGYGGFEIAMVPSYNANAGVGWMEKGASTSSPTSEAAASSARSGTRPPSRPTGLRAYEDFAAVAEDLIVRKVTTPAHLGIQGGSNGGLLMGNMLTRRPELFGAVVCQVPLLDMKRYHTLLAGASWMGEYGNPDVPEEWSFIQGFSPYHMLKEGVKYPRTLFTTSTRDDRVHPGHARKMAAKMKEMGLDLVYYENIEGGHGGAADNKQAAFMSALAYTFLWNQLK